MNEITVAPSGKRFIAAILDLIIALFLGLGIFALVQNFTLKTDKAKEAETSLINEEINSHLFSRNENGEITSNQYSDYSYYLEDLKYYYGTYLNQYNPYEFNVMILGLDDTQNLLEEKINQRSSFVTEYGHLYFEYTDNVNDYAVLKSTLYVDNDASKGLTDKNKSLILNYFYSTSSNSLYYEAYINFVSLENISSLIDQYNLYAKGIPFYVSFPFTYILIYLVLPMIFKNSQTLGKKLLKLCVVSKSGFQIKKKQIILRCLPTLLLCLISYFFLGQVYCLILSLGCLFISYICSLTSFHHQAIHDLIAYTVVVDDQNSIFFKDYKEKELYEDNIKNLAK